MVKIRLLGYVASLAKFKKKEIQISKKTKVKDLLGVRISEDKVIVLINGLSASLGTEVSNTDEIVVLPIIGGGEKMEILADTCKLSDNIYMIDANGWGVEKSTSVLV
ncbi:MAG: MoaD/ThiS family protein, partial [Promethearchaeota archaeon]